MVWRFFTWLGEVAGGFCAAFLTFVALFGAIGFAIATPYSPEITCWPQHSVIYVYETFCESKVADTAWWGTVELARFPVAMPALSIHYAQDLSLRWPYSSLIFETMVWVATGLVLLAVWAGFRHWRARLPLVAWGLLATYVAMAIAVAVPVDLSVPVANTCNDEQRLEYFPRGSFRGYPSERYPHPHNPALGRDWFSSHLFAMQEAPLFCGASPDSEVYRFLWLRTFDEPVAVRVYRRGRDHGLEAVILDGRGGYEPGNIKKRIAKVLSQAEWQRVVRELDRVRFWQMRTTTDDMIGIDGTEWIMEGRRAGRYHVASRWGGYALERTGILFLELAGVDAPEPVF